MWTREREAWRRRTTRVFGACFFGAHGRCRVSTAHVSHIINCGSPPPPRLPLSCEISAHLCFSCLIEIMIVSIGVSYYSEDCEKKGKGHRPRAHKRGFVVQTAHARITLSLYKFLIFAFGSSWEVGMASFRSPAAEPCRTNTVWARRGLGQRRVVCRGARRTPPQPARLSTQKPGCPSARASCARQGLLRRVWRCYR